MSIERTRPMRIHKRLVIHALVSHPEDVKEIVSAFETAQQAIDYLVTTPGVWLVDGRLMTDAEADAYEAEHYPAD